VDEFLSGQPLVDHSHGTPGALCGAPYRPAGRADAVDVQSVQKGRTGQEDPHG
jgi:hypothetical protein